MHTEDTITDKRGGICFRVDDNRPADQWTAFAEIFDRYGYKFCAALCPGKMADDDYLELVRKLQSGGHEILDHTPIHSVDKLPLHPGDDPEKWRRLPGVDHVDHELIYLTYEPIEAGPYPTGSADISGKRITAREPGDLADMGPPRYFALWLPDLGQVCRFDEKGEKDGTGLELRSFWGEDNVDLGEHQNTTYYKLQKEEVYITLEARKRLAETSLELFEACGLERPKTWIQPGSGGCSNFDREAIRTCFGDLYGYVSAAIYPGRSQKCHNEHDPHSDKCFGMQWGNFNDEAKDLDWNKKRIADGIAKHHVLIGHSHFQEHVMPDGWDGYLKRVDAILAWCRQSGIPVHTYSEWAKILYRTPQDPAINVFPPLDVDLDGDGVPDGYDTVEGRIDTDGGPPEGGAFLTVDQDGPIARIERLGGMEKGDNTFTVWTRGGGGKLEVTFDFFELGKKAVFSVPADGPAWSRHVSTVNVPAEASLANVTLTGSGVGTGGVAVGGLSLTGAT